MSEWTRDEADAVIVNLERELAAMTRERDALVDDSITGRDGALAQIKELRAEVERLQERADNLAVECQAAIHALGRGLYERIRAALGEEGE